MPASPGGNDGKERSSLAAAMRKAGPYLNIGWSFVTPIVAGLALGWYLDKRFGWDPWAKLAGMLLGMGLGFLSFFNVVLALAKKTRRPDGDDDA